MSKNFIDELNRLCDEQIAYERRPSWVYHVLKADFDLERHHLELIGSRLGFRRGWAWHRWQEIEAERAESARCWEELRRECEKAKRDAEAEQAEAEAARAKAEQAAEAERRRSVCPVQRALMLFGLEEPFSHKDLKRAYRRVALQRHPDVGGSHADFLVVGEFYQLLEPLVVGGVK